MAARSEPRARSELQQFLISCRTRGYAHRIISDKLARYAVALHIPALIFGVLSAVFSYFLPQDNVITTNNLQYVIMGLSTISVFINSVDNYLEFGKKAVRHDTASRTYESLATRISRYLSGDSGKLETHAAKTATLLQQAITSAEVPTLPVSIEDGAYRMVKDQLRRMSESFHRHMAEAAAAGAPEPAVVAAAAAAAEQPVHLVNMVEAQR